MNPILKMLGTGPWMALLRYGLTAAGAAITARGYADAATVQVVTGAILTAVPAIAGAVLAKRDNRIKIVAAMPEVDGITLASGEVVTMPNPPMNDR